MKLTDKGKVIRETPLSFEVRELTRDDLIVLAQKRDVSHYAPKRFRDPHHRLAKLLAFGLRVADAAAKAGYSVQRAGTLQADPAFRDLVAKYARQMTDSFAESVDDYTHLATSNMLKAERMLAEKLDAADEEGETLPTRELIAISRDAADRFGYGKKQTNLNVNVDFAAQLEARLKRVGKTIDAPSLVPPAGFQAPAQPTEREMVASSPSPFRRRA